MRNRITLYLGHHYYDTVVSDIESGASIRNKRVFSGIVSELKRNGLYVIFKKVAKIWPMKLSNVPSYTLAFLFRRMRTLEPLSLYFLSRAKPGVSISDMLLKDSVLFLHHYFDLITIDFDERIPTIVEMPELVSETAGYLSKHRIGTTLLHNSLIDKLRNAMAITVAAKRDMLAIKKYVSAKIFLIFNVFPSAKVAQWEYIERLKERSLAIVGWGDYRDRLRLALTIAKYNLPFTKIYVLNAHRFDFTIRRLQVIGYPWLSRDKWLDILSRSMFTVFSPKIPWLGGHSVRLNDAALTGNVIIGGECELRDVPYMCCYTYVDERDLIAKLEELLHLDPISLGYKNWLIAMERAQKSSLAIKELARFIIESF